MPETSNSPELSNVSSESPNVFDANTSDDTAKLPDSTVSTESAKTPAEFLKAAIVEAAKVVSKFDEVVPLRVVVPTKLQFDMIDYVLKHTSMDNQQHAKSMDAITKILLGTYGSIKEVKF
jgi:hypothetical protein